MVGAKASDEEIALHIGLSLPTLRKYYFRELEHGVALARNEMVRKLYKAGMAGNVAAMKAYLAETEKAAAIEASRPVRRPPQPGKKEERQAAAEQVGGLYAPGPAPQLN